MQGNTSINPFFYGTYLGETKPGEPVTRTEKEAFQADAVGAAHQLTPAHFNVTHTFRVEWQPGPGGRIDWYSRGHRINDTFSMEGDGLGTDWVHAFSILDKVLKKTMGSQIPIEPSALIFNTAVSSTWGFPYDTPEWCEKCYDCDDPKCACAFAPGFCKMLRESDVAMYIDSVRVYQSRDPSAHVGANHTIGCDPPEFPTRGWIEGHSYRYMRNAPFSYKDKGPIKKKIQNGGGECLTDKDCGSHLKNVNLTAVHESGEDARRLHETKGSTTGRGKCINSADFKGMFAFKEKAPKVCQCNPGFIGPHCLAENHIDDTPSAYEQTTNRSIFVNVASFRVSSFMIFLVTAFFVNLVGFSFYVTSRRNEMIKEARKISTLKRPIFKDDLAISGASI